MKITISLCLLLLLAACETKQESKELKQAEIHPLVGSWKMIGITEEGQDASARHNPSNNRYISFSEDGSFRSWGDPYGENTGRWEFDSSHQELFIDSDAGEGDDSYWVLSFASDTLHWRGIKSPFTERMRMQMLRSE